MLRINRRKTEGETVEIEGYKVRFIWKKRNMNENQRKKLKKMCIQVFENSKAYGDIPNIGFVIEEKKGSNNEGWVKTSEVTKHKSYLAHLNYHQISKQWRNKDQVRRIIRHELVHLWDYHNNIEKMQKKAAERFNEVNKEIESEFQELIEKLEKDGAVNVKTLRTIIGLFLYRIRSEGLALNLDKSISLEYDNKNEAYLGIREEAEDAAEKIRNQFRDKGRKESPDYMYESQTPYERAIYGEETDEVEEAIQDLQNIISEGKGQGRQYPIGKHVVHSIRLVTDLTIDEIADLGPRELIKTYEKAESNYKHDRDPVISLNSGQGIIDYNRMLKKTERLFNELNLLES